MWNETLRASPDGGQGYVWLLSCTEVALKVHLSLLVVLRLQFQGNHSEESGLLPRPPANVWGDQVHDPPWSSVLQVFIDTEEPIFPTEGIYSSGDYKALMNLVWIKKTLISIVCIFVQITHTEEMPESMMMKNAVISVFFLRFLQHGKYFKRHVPEKKKVCFWVNLVKLAANYFFPHSIHLKQTEPNLMHNKRPVGKTLWNVHKWRKNKKFWSLNLGTFIFYK